MIKIDFGKRNKFAEESDGELYRCFQCSTCTVNCSLVDAMPVRKIIRYMQLGHLPRLDGVWECLTCNYCRSQCPSDVNIASLIRVARKFLYEDKWFPEDVNEILWRLYEEGNPLGSPRGERFSWVEIPSINPSPDIIIYTCCLVAYDRRGQKTILRLIALLKNLGLTVDVFREGACCGDIVYQIGEEYFYEEIINENVEKLERLKPSIILTISPHVYHNLKNLYPKYGAKINIPIMHHTQLIQELIESGKIELGRIKMDVTYHDPCYLARYNDVVNEPRDILSAIDGINLIELPHNKGETLCCGGGGGGIWLDNKWARNSTKNRLSEVRELGVDKLVTACPYCIRMFEDEASMEGLDIEVHDIIDLLSMAIQ